LLVSLSIEMASAKGVVPMLDQWLQWVEREPTPYSFPVVDVYEKGTMPAQLQESLANCIRDAYLDPEVLRKLTAKYGATAVYEKIVRPSIPTLKTVDCTLMIGQIGLGESGGVPY